jgi:competence protein ComEC
MDWWLASFFLGSILSLFLPIVPDLFVLFLLILFSIILFSYKPLRLSSGLFFGASWMLCSAFNYQHLWQDNNLNSLELASSPLWVQGQVSSLQFAPDAIQLHHDKKLLRFNIDVTHLNSQKLNTSIKLRLSWKNANFIVQQGQVVQLKVKFKPAHGLANIGGFSYQTWLRSQRILATGYVIEDKSNRVLQSDNSIRQQLFNTYNNLLPPDDLSPLLLALGFGSRSELNQELWQVLQRTGTGHLIAISGLHIGLVASGSYLFFMLCIRLLPLNYCNQLAFFQTLNIRYVAITLSLGVGIVYGYLAGYSLPTIRALMMLTIYCFSRAIKVHLSIKRWLLLTLFLLTLTMPFSLFTASFWLSVYAVTIIFITIWRFKNMLNNGNTVWRFVKGLIIIQLSLTLMLLPVSAAFFKQVSLVALFANLVAVPWMSFVTIPLCLLSVLVVPFSESFSQFLMACCIDSLQVLWHFLSFLSQQTWAVLKLSNVNTQLLILLGFISFIYIFFNLPVITKSILIRHQKMDKKLSMLFIGSFCLFFTVSINSSSSREQQENTETEWQLVIFDVGQGLSVLVQQGSHGILYDTGAAYPSGFTMADAVILPYLQHSGLKHLDKMIISHSDNDHAGGLTVIQNSMAINELIYNDKSSNSATCLQGESFVWQNLHFNMLWPKHHVSKDNDDSCVILISDGKHSVLLTGDISKKVEKALMKQYPKLSPDIIVVPHHGSKTSSSELFLSKLQPTLAVVSAGYLNRWHMPVTEVVKRYQQHNIELLNTAESGQIKVIMSEQGISMQTYYRDLWPFWFAH